MSDVSAAQPVPAASAGALLRQARQARGLHLMALSASLKVPATRLEAMEEDRWHDLPDAAYARALAHTVCRALGIDPQPVLRSLPAASQPRLETLDEGLDEPFRDTSTAAGLMPLRHRWAVVGLGLALAVAVWWWLDSASGALRPAAATDAPRPAASAAVPAPPGGQQEQTVTVAPSPVAVPGSAPVASGNGLRIVATQPSWIELREAQGEVRLARLLGAGETLELPLGAPARLTVGNAAATAVWVGGQPIDLSGSARENVARIELR
jgi:cytoskeleton protein RodZ